MLSKSDADASPKLSFEYIHVQRRGATNLKIRALAALFCAACIACAGEDGSDVTPADDSVVPARTVSEAPLWSDDEGWRIRELLRIGKAFGDEGDWFAGPLLSVNIGPHGNIFVLDEQADRVKVYRPNGDFLRFIGRPGRGPGELSSPTAFAWDAHDRLWVTNAFQRRYTVFDSLGNFVKRVPRPTEGASRLQHRLLFTADDLLLDQGAFMREPRSHFFFLVDTLGSIVRHFPVLEDPFITDEPLVGKSIPLAGDHFPRRKWTLSPRGNIWFANSGKYRLFERTPEGDTLRILEAHHRSETISRPVMREIRSELRGAGLDEDDVQLVRPLIQAIHALPDGHLMVQVVDSVGADSSVLDIFDPRGRLLGTVQAPFPLEVLAMPAFVGDTMFAATEGAAGVSYIVKAVIER